MDGVTEQPALAPGQHWRHNDGSPWPSTSPVVEITELAPGWVRFYHSDSNPDERMTEAGFRAHYNQRVNP